MASAWATLPGTGTGAGIVAVLIAAGDTSLRAWTVIFVTVF
jgi:hypothetical protein